MKNEEIPICIYTKNKSKQEQEFPNPDGLIFCKYSCIGLPHGPES